MKKFFVLVIAIFLLVSCSMVIKDPEGWEIFQCGWALSENEVLIQSHDGYVLNEIFYTEHIDTIYKTDSEEKTVTIENRLNKQIDVKLTYNTFTKWVKINANDSYLIEVSCFQ